MVNPWQFTRWTKADGLASNRVMTMTQDAGGLWWFGTDQGLQRFDGRRFRTWRHDPEDPCSLPADDVLALHTDENGRLWVATSAGIGRFDPRSGTFTPVPGPQGPVRSGFPVRFLRNSRDELWFFNCDFEGSYRYRPQTDTWEQVPLRPDLRLIGDCVHEERSTGDLWFHSFHGPGHWQRASGTTTLSVDEQAEKLPRGLEGHPSSLYVDSGKTLWVQARQPGSIDFHLFTRRLPDGAYRKSGYRLDRSARFHEDRHRRLWYFTTDVPWFGYIDLNSGVQHRFRYLPEANLADSEVAAGVMGIYEDREANIWILIGPEIWVFNPSRQAIQSRQAILTPNGSVEPLKNVSCLFESGRGDLWVGTYFGGIQVFDKDLRLRQVVRSDPSPAGTPDTLNQVNYNAVWSFAEDADGRIWAGGQHGTMQLFSAEGRLLKRWQLPPPNNKTVRAMVQGADGGLWLGLQYGAVLHLDPRTGQMRWFIPPDDGKRVRHTGELLPDGPDRLWAHIDGRLYGLDTRDGRFTVLPGMLKGDPGPINGLLAWDDSTLLVLSRDLWLFDKRRLLFRKPERFQDLGLRHVYRAVKDAKGRIWFVDASGLGHWDTRTNRVCRYDRNDGLPGSEYSDFRSMLRLQDGRVLAGAGVNGFLAFHPDSLSAARVPRDVVLLGVRTPEGEIPLPEPGEALEFPHDVNLVSVTFASPSLVQLAGLRYLYRLDGPNSEWLDNGSRGSIELNGLAPGRYDLEIRAVNREGLSSRTTATLRLRILPPWWSSPWARIVYALLVVYLGYRLYRYALRRRLEQAEVRRIRELEAFKSKFYTNITHEFRTPLTVIDGMATLIRENPQAWLDEGLSAIRSSSDRMMKLVNQILDLSKLDSGSLTLRRERLDLVLFIRYLCDSLRPLAKAEGIALDCHTDLETLYLEADEERLRQIVENLLSNALKFTPEGGRVEVSLHVEPPVPAGHSVQQVCIRVADTGIGIAPEHMPHLFDAYFRAEDEAALQVSGTGIGLPFARELALLMGGDILVESEKGKGSVFTLRIPLTPAPAPSLVAVPEEEGPSSLEKSGPEANGKAEILVIEDDPDVSRYIEAVLSDEYTVRTAADGEAGIRLCRARVPDLVVSDVMMPGMDGLQLTALLRSEVLTSHIPIVLLTGKAGIEDRLDGLEQGADAYLTKPFDRRELSAVVQRLLQNRTLLREYYLAAQGLEQDHAPEPPTPVALSARESAFLEQVREAVDRHLDDPDYTVERLASGVFMSQSQLHRKLKAVAGLSPVQYIRRVRLQHARELLSGQPDLPVYAVAQACGFDDPAYFVRVFRQEFGVTPAAWRNGST